MAPWIRLGAGAALVVALAGVGWAVLRGDGRPVAIDPGDSALLALGREIYARECASCHGRDLEGQANWRVRRPDGRLPAPPHDATGHTWHHPDQQLFAMTRDGIAPFAPPGYRTDMPAYAGRLTDHEIRAVLAYIKSRWPEEIQARQAEITRRSRDSSGK